MLSSLPGNFVDLRNLPADSDLVAELRTLNAQHGTDSPRLFALVLDETEADDLWGSGPSVWLNAGIGGATGLLRWVDDTGSYIPSDPASSRSAMLTYLDPHGELSEAPAYLKVPIDQVFEAVAELLRTKQRPTCVQWIPEPR